MLFYSNIESPVGTLHLLCREDAVCRLWLDDQNHGIPENVIRDDLQPVILDVKDWLAGYFAGLRPSPVILPLHPEGTQFQKQVWSLLQTIPYGQTVTYGHLAKQLAHPRMSAQAVGQAVGRNPISIILPCHRVMGAGNRLTGYHWGIDKKLLLLRHEGIDTTQMVHPQKQHG